MAVRSSSIYATPTVDAEPAVPLGELRRERRDRHRGAALAQAEAPAASRPLPGAPPTRRESRGRARAPPRAASAPGSPRARRNGAGRRRGRPATSCPAATGSPPAAGGTARSRLGRDRGGAASASARFTSPTVSVGVTGSSAPHLRGQLIEQAGMPRAVLLAAREQIGPPDEGRLGVVAHAARLDVDDPFEVGQLGLGRQRLVDLLLALGDQTRASAVGSPGHGAHRDRAGLGHQPLGPVLGLDRHAVSRPHAERQQPVGRALDEVAVLGPGGLLPDAQRLLAQRHTPRFAAPTLADPAGDRRDDHGHASTPASTSCSSPR